MAYSGPGLSCERAALLLNKHMGAPKRMHSVFGGFLPFLEAGVSADVGVCRAAGTSALLHMQGSGLAMSAGSSSC